MNERPGTVPGPAPARPSHPRRPPAHQSVSLRHSPPRRSPPTTLGTAPTGVASASPTGPASDQANPPSSVSPRLDLHHRSSGESSDAAGWFEQSNNARAHDASFVDHDPPFLLNTSSSSDRTPPDAHPLRVPLPPPPPPPPHRPALMRLGTDGGSSNEDFRSVIDDLTVANKKLKQRLRKYEKVYDAHLQHEKLFEVRFHRLPDHKKKELEATLRNFAASLDDADDRPDIASAPALRKDPTASATSRFTESGYASMSASGQNSSTPSNGPVSQGPADTRRMTKSAYNRQQQSIQSFLHDIPPGLLPQHNASMSDKARRKMIVRRLEQIFAGKHSVPGQHPQPMQQEEVAQSAATADRREREADGRASRPEGQRTALIMPQPGQGGPVLLAPAQQRFHDHGSDSPDQRPTRPLDLDPYRAQVPAANMDYFRHLGFSPPDMTTTAEAEEGHGWLYLNLLINLAQLHTLNVTPDNVKAAIAEYSTQLELSSDGRKIRWKGGHDFSKDSSEGSPEQMAINSPYHMMGAQRSPHKSFKTGNSASIESSGYGGSEHHSRTVAPVKPQVESNKFAYKPLFFRKESSEDDVDLYDPTDSTGSLFQPQQRGDSSGLGSSAMQSSLSGKRRDDGPMIFYTKARFCTDFTGDRAGASLTLPENYKTITSHPLGAQLNTDTMKPDMWEPRGPLDDDRMDIDSKTGAQTPSTLESLGFSPDDLQRDICAASPHVMDFEASGLGGVQPDDNFSIRVSRAQIPTVHKVYENRQASLYPSKIQAILGGNEGSQQERRRSSSSRKAFEEKMISVVRQDMPSSALPAPSFFPLDSHSSGDLSDDEESSDSASDCDSDTGDGPSTALQLLNIAPPSRPRLASERTGMSTEASQYSEDDDDDVSIDLLATARQQDPDTVRAFEREYDAAVADRLAEKILAGSSAATAGGGSGFNSPASHSAGRKQERRSTRNAQSSNSDASMSPHSRSLKRARTGESFPTVTKGGSKALKSQRIE